MVVSLHNWCTFPILSDQDINHLKDKSFWKGCFTSQELPFEINDCTPDLWLNNVIAMMNKENLSNNFDGEREDGLLGLQILMSELSNLRSYEKSMGISLPESAEIWCEQVQSVIDSGVLPEVPSPFSSVLVKTPDEVLGCQAKRVILVEPTADCWDLRVTLPPLLQEEERQRLGILRPDGPIRHTRHLLRWIYYSGEEVVVIDPTTLDESSPPVAPYVEYWRDNTSSETLPSFLSSQDFFEGSGWCRVNHKDELLVVAEDRNVESYSDGSSTVVIENVHGVSWRSKRSTEGNLLLKRQQTTTAPLSYTSALITLESQHFIDRIQRQPSLISGSEAYHAEAKIRKSVVSTKPLAIIPKAKHLANDLPLPVENSSWPVIGGIWKEKETMSIDPRPLFPSEIEIEAVDYRHGHSPGNEWKVPDVWSPSRIQSWIECGRKGWLSQALHAGSDEIPDEELDTRTRGVLIHEVTEGMIEKALGMSRSIERSSFTPRSVANSGTDENELMTNMARLLDEHAPWLSRSDVVTDERLRDLVGMDEVSWRSWLSQRQKILPSGRFAEIISAEFGIPDSVPICMEYKIGKDVGNGQGTIIGTDKAGNEIKVRGSIDRVDLVPFGKDGKLIDESGDFRIAPLYPDGKWKPRRLVLIRDIKTAEKDRGKDKHLNALLEDVQLAIYARAWEIEHPGDLVIGVGVSDIGLETTHHVEIDPEWARVIDKLEIGEITNVLTGLFRPETSTSTSPSQSGFRAWLNHRLNAVFNAVNAARNRRVAPNPSSICSYCSVSHICGLSEIGGEGKWV